MKDNQRQHIHILGICGTFMGGLALLAKEKKFNVTGADANVYPPMSHQLESQGIKLIQGYEANQLDIQPDVIIVGNAMSRGKQPVVEEMLNQRLNYISGPQWIAENVLRDKKVIAVAGTHGKTTTASMVAWILEYAGFSPGFLIGGVPENFGVSARLGQGNHFVIEADEYDTAFFDKRSKFLHYHPDILILNNLEFDHADIFQNLAAIEKQFEYLLRTVPANGKIIKNNDDENLTRVLARGVWTSVETFGTGDWKIKEEFSQNCFGIIYQNKIQGEIQWELFGKHNQYNALAAIAAAHHAGVEIKTAIKALSEFKNVKRRLEKLGKFHFSEIYSDFAHHPTAIKTTLEGLRLKVGNQKIIAIVECGSNTMRIGTHRETLAQSLKVADHVIFLRPINDWGIESVKKRCAQPAEIAENIDQIIEKIKLFSEMPQSHIVLMSNTSFNGLFEKLSTWL